MSDCGYTDREIWAAVIINTGTSAFAIAGCDHGALIKVGLVTGTAVIVNDNLPRLPSAIYALAVDDSTCIVGKEDAIEKWTIKDDDMQFVMNLTLENSVWSISIMGPDKVLAGLYQAGFSEIDFERRTITMFKRHGTVNAIVLCDAEKSCDV